MPKYYTRACNFYYGNQAKYLIKNNNALSLCGYKDIAFDNLEIFTRENRKVKSKIIHIRNIKKLHLSLRKKIKDLDLYKEQLTNRLDPSMSLMQGINAKVRKNA